MRKYLLLLFVLSFFSLVALSQANTQSQKECRISSGIGIASAAENTKSVGRDFWLQLDYKLSENFSIATEFENMSYIQPGYYENLPITPNEIQVVDDNFSLLLKYHFSIKSPIKIAVASGWTYTTRQSQYYIYTVIGTGSDLLRNVTSFNDYRIPLLLEIEYPISKKINIEARGKYNFNPQNGDTYSTGIGLSLKL